jgi:hypothetical protein
VTKTAIAVAATAATKIAITVTKIAIAATKIAIAVTKVVIAAAMAIATINAVAAVAVAAAVITTVVTAVTTNATVAMAKAAIPTLSISFDVLERLSKHAQPQIQLAYCAMVDLLSYQLLDCFRGDINVLLSATTTAAEVSVAPITTAFNGETTKFA